MHAAWLHELMLELDYLKHNGNPADHDEYEKIERALAPIVQYARAKVTAIGKMPHTSPALQAAIAASMKKEAEKRAEMAQKRQMPMTDRPRSMMVPQKTGKRMRAFSHDPRDWL